MTHATPSSQRLAQAAALAACSLSLCCAAFATGHRPAPGEDAPGVSLQATSGGKVDLADYRGKQTVVLAFFPKAFTGGCTKEMKNWGAAFEKVGAADAKVFGVSTDDLETQRKFAASLTLPFPLLADPDGTAAKAWGVYTPGVGLAARTTFVISPEGKVLKVIEGGDAIDPSPAIEACPRRKT
jgi:thioredoxin-dependent peroxiredoxin